MHDCQMTTKKNISAEDLQPGDVTLQTRPLHCFCSSILVQIRAMLWYVTI